MSERRKGFPKDYAITEERKAQILSILQPGNLAFGTLLDPYSQTSVAKLQSIIERGITTALAVGQIYSISSDYVSLAMIPRDGNYLTASDYGPKTDQSGRHLRMGIILSRTELLAKYPSQVTAVGRAFGDPLWERSFPTQGTAEDQVSSYGIPIEHPRVGVVNPHHDEVRVYYPNRDKTLPFVPLTPDTWAGVVLPTDYFNTAQFKQYDEYFEQLEGLHNIPILTVQEVQQTFSSTNNL